MKSLFQRVIALLLLCAVGAVVVLTGNSYFKYVSQSIYDESTSHLSEVYGQVNKAFHVFLERSWRDLTDWGSYLHQVGDAQGEEYIRQRQAYWQFSRFYFIGQDGSCITPDGVPDELTLGEARDQLLREQSYIMEEEPLPDGRPATLFAIPVERAVYRGFPYCAIGISYTNADIVQSLDVDAFDGQSQCFVIHDDGRVLLSTQPGGSVFGNYLAYLRAGSDLSEEQLDGLLDDWQAGRSGVLRFRLGDDEHYLSYQPVGYQSCVLLGVVPGSAAGRSLRQIQGATTRVLVELFALIGALLLGQLLHYSWEQRRRDTLELRYRELMFDTLSSSVADVFVMLDGVNWKVDYISPNVEHLLGLLPEAVEADVRALSDSIPGENREISREEMLAIPVGGERCWEREHVHLRTGERSWFRETIYHKNLQGMEKFLIVMSDRTQERTMNQSLQQALDSARSANQAKSHFLSNMSHDIRTPMNAIIGFTVLLAKDAAHPDKVREYTRKISASGQHLLGLINDILDMSKIESGKTSLNIAPFSLPGLMEELYAILAPQARAKQQSFQFHVQGCPAEQLMGDKLRLNQILINLLSNAIKYTQDGGTIDFIVQELPPVLPQYARICFAVRDNGMGMSEDFQKTVFDAFSREKNSTISGIQGTGLGMAITRNLVELMGGVIEVRSEPGKGSTFTVELSFALPAEEAGHAVWQQYNIARVLVADDDPGVCRDIQAMMRDTGVEVVCAGGGAEAAEAAEKALMEGRPFDIILLDWKMPGVDGAEAARRIRKTQAGPLVVLTFSDWADIEAEAREAGIDAYLPKPFFVSSFRRVVENLFSGRQALPSEEPAEDAALEGLMFLVAEDNELNAEILSEMLAMEGAQCDRAVNGWEAFEAFRASEPGHYDMILMDVQMPVMNGYEATRKIRACEHPQAGSIPIVAMTANAFADDVRNAIDAGMDGHLAKPVDFDLMKGLLGQLRQGSHHSSKEGGK